MLSASRNPSLFIFFSNTHPQNPSPFTFSFETLARSLPIGPRKAISLLFTGRRVRRIDLRTPLVAAASGSRPPSSHREIEPSPRPLPDPESTIFPSRSPQNPTPMHFFRSPEMCPQTTSRFFVKRYYNKIHVLPALLDGEDEDDDETDQIGTLPAAFDDDLLMCITYSGS